MSSVYLNRKLIRIFEIIICFLLCGILVLIIFANVAKTKKYLSVVSEASERFSVEISLILAVIKVESDFNERAVSGKQALGLMQITANTFEYVCNLYDLNYDREDIFDVVANVNAGAAYLDYLYKKFGTEKEALAAYNAGEGNVSLWLGDQRYSKDGKSLDVVPFKETDRYVKKVSFYKDCYYKRFGSSRNHATKIILDKNHKRGQDESGCSKGKRNYVGM